MGLARRNIEAPTDDHCPSTSFLRWTGKRQANRRLIGLRFTRSVVMNLDDEIGALGNKPRILSCWRLSHRAWNPSADQVNAGHSSATETRIAAVVAGTPARSTGRVDKYQRMMHDASIAGPELRTAHIDVMIEIHRQKETPELIVTTGRE